MGSNHQVLAADFETPGMNRERVLFDVECFRVFEDVAAVRIDFRQKSREILQRMKFGLVRETHAGPIRIRNFLDELRIETKLRRQLGVLLESLAIFVAGFLY